jgi:UPF0271 protein
MGEGMATDADIFPFISSANIACGAHAGDGETMRVTVEQALRHGVAIGAHPSYADRVHFGRIDVLESASGKGDRSLGFAALPDLLYEQLHRLQTICDQYGVRLHHVKPHGALYNRAAKDAEVSALICRAVAAFDPSLLLYGLSGSEMERQAGVCGLSFVSEVFADRGYRSDGSLVPRSEAHALIEDPEEAIAQVLKMVREGKVRVAGMGEIDGVMKGGVQTTGAVLEVPLRAETVCIHGDGVHAVEFARIIHDVLLTNGIDIKRPYL